MSGEVNVAANRLLELLIDNRDTIIPVPVMMAELGLTKATAKQAITVLRRRGHNVRNRRGEGFWLENGPAPPLGPPGEGAGDGRWQS